MEVEVEGVMGAAYGQKNPNVPASATATAIES
jgi:hypothetical protein